MNQAIEGSRTMERRDRRMAICFVLLYVVSLIPVLYVAQYDCATGDDYGFGAAARRAFVNTGSVAAAVLADLRHVGEVYQTWQGTWLSCFLFGLHPEVFHYHAYVIVPWIMLAVLTAGVMVFAHHFLTQKFHFTAGFAVTAAVILLTVMVQFVPDKRFAYYWWNGSVHYTVPFVLALLSLVCADRWISGVADEENERRKGKRKNGKGIRDFVFLCILGTALGGMSYPAALLAPVLIFLFLLPKLYRRTELRKRALALLLPAALEGIGLVISAKAPGNRVRGGESFGFHLGLIIVTIGRCFADAVVTALRFLRQTPLLLLAVVLFEWILIREIRRRQKSVTVTADDSRKNQDCAGQAAQTSMTHFSAAKLLEILFFSFLGYTATFAPELYAGVSVSEGVGNTYYLCFVLMLFVDLTAATVFVCSRRAETARTADDRGTAWLPDTAAGSSDTSAAAKTDKRQHCLKKYAICVVILILLAGYSFCFRRSLKNSVDYMCYDFVRTGNAARFHSEMELQNRLLTENPDPDIVIPMTNGYDGPIMHMPVVEDSTAWTNQKTAEFYGKRTVTGVKREVWEAEHKE